MAASESILIIDDNAANLKLVEVTLSFAGYTVCGATEAGQALAALAACRPQLILMDLQLPGTDGLSLTRRLKADPATRDIPILALTSYAMKGDEQKALTAGCDGYFTKPIDTRTFPGEITAFLAARRKSCAA